MKLKDLLPVIERITDHRRLNNQRAVTYLATYPSICAVGAMPGVIQIERFHQLAAMAYGWMPRVLRVNPHCTRDALAALERAQNATAETLLPTESIQAVSDCLYSVVGASKVLHFIKPNVFPIWDSKIERFRLNGKQAYSNKK